MRFARIFLMLSLTCVATSLIAEDKELQTLVRKLETGKPAEKTQAAQLIGELGPSSAGIVPALIQALKSDDPALRHELVVALGRIHSDPNQTIPALVRLLSDSSPIIRYSAIDALRIWGTAAKSSVDTLNKSLSDTEQLVRVAAARAIVQIENRTPESIKRVLPELINGLKSDHEEISTEAIRALAAIGQPAVTAVQELVGNHHSRACINACEALAAIGTDAGTSIDQLIAAAKSSDPKLRWHAIHAIGQLGPEAKSAIPTLIGFLADSDVQIAFVTEQSLQQIGKPSISALIEGLKDDKRRMSVVRVITGIGPDAADAVPQLAPLLQNANPELQREVVLALAAIGSAAKSTAPELIKLLEDAKFPFRQVAAFALGKLRVSESVPSLKRSLEVPNNAILRLASVWALIQIDPSNEELVSIAVPQLISALDNEKPQIRTEAARTLGQLGARSKGAVSGLQKKLTDSNSDVRREALVALAEIGSESAPAVTEIIRLANEDDPAIRPIACYALGRIGAASKPAIPLLHRMLNSRDPHEQTVAAWALVTISPDKESIDRAIPLLASALRQSENPKARAEAAKTLGKIGSGSHVAKEALKAGLDDPDETVRKAAQASSELLK